MLNKRNDRKELRSLLLNFKQWFSDYDSCYLLCFYNFYFLTNASMKTDEEIEESGFSSIYSDILQGIALMQERVSNSRPLGSNRDEFIRQISLLNDYIKLKAFGKQEGDISDLLDSGFITNQMKFNTMRIQNWGYGYQMEAIIRDIFNLLDKEFYRQFNVPGAVAARLFTDLIRVIERHITTHYFNVQRIKACPTKKSAIRSYEKLFGSLDSKNIDLDFQQLLQPDSRLEVLKDKLVQLADLQLPICFSFTAKKLAKHWGCPEVESLQALLNRLSYGFQDLKNQSFDDLLLGNPVRKKPFIKLDDGSFLCITLGSLLDRSLDVINDLVSVTPELAQRYTDVRSEYAEKYVSKVLRRHFNQSQIVENIKWTRSDSPKQFETDHLLIIDKFALVFETKSGKVSPLAKKGIQPSMENYIEDLILKPSRQANNFIEAAERGLIHNIKDRSGKRVHIDFKNIKYYLPVSITFEFLADLMHAKPIFNAKIRKSLREHDINLCISMVDLEHILEILTMDSIFLHYLVRRRELEAHAFLMGDEMDFLQFYIKGGFNHLGDDEYSGRPMSPPIEYGDIDRYFTSRKRKPRNRPRLDMTAWWYFLIKSMDKKKPHGWLEASFALLNCTKEQQEEIERSAQIIRSMRKRKNSRQAFQYKHLMLIVGAGKRKTILIFFLYQNLGEQERNARMCNFMAQTNIAKCQLRVALGINIKKRRMPCDSILTDSKSLLIEQPLHFIDIAN